MITDEQRRAAGLRTVDEVLALAETGTVVLDPYSVLVGVRVRLGTANVLYPGVLIQCDHDSDCILGEQNTLFPGVFVSATGGGSVVVGDGNQLGEGGARIGAGQPEAVVRIGDRTRISGGAFLTGPADVGDGSQILGAIDASRVRLEAGGDWTCPDPDERGAVLKGVGRAREIVLGPGEVLNGSGDFATAPVERQLAYHPRSTPGG